MVRENAIVCLSTFTPLSLHGYFRWNWAKDQLPFIPVARQVAFMCYLSFKVSQEVVIKPNIIIFIITEGKLAAKFSTFYCNQLISGDRSGTYKNITPCSVLLSLQQSYMKSCGALLNQIMQSLQEEDSWL